MGSKIGRRDFIKAASLAGGLMVNNKVLAKAGCGTSGCGSLRAGVGKVSITSKKAKALFDDPAVKAALGISADDTITKSLVHDPLYARALVMDDGKTRLAVITMDISALGGYGEVGYDFLPALQKRIQSELGLKPENVIVNASHTHLVGGQLCDDLVGKTTEAVKEACRNMVPVKVGAGKGYEDRIMMNRRILLRSGEAWIIRHANPCPPDGEIVAVGPVDPEIGILRIDRADGTPLAVVYNFACHPYLGVRGGGVTADFPGFASEVIEDNTGCEMAMFLQGAAGDITEILYKDVNRPRDSKAFGRMLGLSTLKALKSIETKQADLNVISTALDMPKRTDIPQRLKAMEEEQAKLLDSLRGTSLNIKTFVPLYIKYALNPDTGGYYAYRYLHEEMMGIKGLKGMDAENKRNVEKYLKNTYAMERLTRLQTNRAKLLEMQKRNDETPVSTIPVDVKGIRIGDFYLVTFPGEASVQVGLNVKKMSPHKSTFMAAYTDGYIHYTPTAEQYREGGYETINCLVGPEWQAIYEKKAAEITARL